MVSDPDKWIDDFAMAGASQYTFHYEASPDPAETIRRIRLTRMKVGMAIKPQTDIECIIGLAEAVDMILVMTVEPGFGGQTLLPACLDKVRHLRKHHPHLNIQVDGGVTLDNLPGAVEAGANVIVAGTLIFGAPDPGRIITRMKEILQSGLGGSI